MTDLAFMILAVLALVIGYQYACDRAEAPADPPAPAVTEVADEHPAAAEHPGVLWMSWGDARAAQRELGKPVFALYTRQNCAPCRRLERGPLSDPDVATMLNTDYYPVRIESADQRVPQVFITYADGGSATWTNLSLDAGWFRRFFKRAAYQRAPYE